MSERSPVNVVWFKRDLRVHDHPALYGAASSGLPIIALYVYEPDLWRQPTADARHLDFIEESLSELDDALRELGVGLTRRTGPVIDVLESLHTQFEIRALWAHQETTDLLGFARDRAVRRWAGEHRLEFHEPRDRGVVRRLADRDGWARQFKALMNEPILVPPAQLSGPPIEPGRAAAAAELGLGPSACTARQIGGRRAALEVTRSFLDERGRIYSTAMSSPVTAYDHSSRLSPYLAFGCVSAREVYQQTEMRKHELRKMTEPPTGWGRSLAAFTKRLHWRDHFTQKLEDEPELEVRAMHAMLDDIRDDLPESERKRRFDAFAAGMTGYPMVDACVRATIETGWLNFRMRAMLVSFASYHLWLDWRPTAELLATWWVDYEPGIHYPQHQMQSGVTGINTLRIYSPTKQVVDQDPTGEFIRAWVPELRDVPDESLAEPRSGDRRLFGGADDYPEPIVEHSDSTRSARSKIMAVRSTAEGRRLSEQVLERHGSRRPAPRRRRRPAVET